MARNILSHLSPKDLRNLGAEARQRLHQTVRGLLHESDRAGLSYVPVFGYLSLITLNHAELGKSSQRKVVEGVDTLQADLPGYAVTPVASTVFRGTPERPGLVAGIAPATGGTVPGVVLAVPKARILELLPRILRRELATENDLKPTGDALPLMYAPQLLPVKLRGGRAVQALVFVSDSSSPKSLHSQGIFRDTDNRSGTPTPGALAWMMTSSGGVSSGGKVGGGAGADYWTPYRDVMVKRRVPVEPWITQALDAAREPVSDAALEQLALGAPSDPVAATQLASLAERFSGAASVLEYRTLQRSDGPVRVSALKKA